MAGLPSPLEEYGLSRESVWGFLWVVVARQTHFGGSLQLPSIDEQRNELFLLRRLDGEDVDQGKKLVVLRDRGRGQLSVVTFGGKWPTVRTRHGGIRGSPAVPGRTGV